LTARILSRLYGFGFVVSAYRRSPVFGRCTRMDRRRIRLLLRLPSARHRHPAEENLEKSNVYSDNTLMGVMIHCMCLSVYHTVIKLKIGSDECVPPPISVLPPLIRLYMRR